MKKTKVLFLCSANIDRSKTAEDLYKNHPALEVKSAGTAPHAIVRVCDALIKEMDIVLCMTVGHKRFIEQNFSDIISDKIIDELDVQDDYRYMSIQLQNILKVRIDAWLLENLNIQPI
ncbi:MAG: hypothetical protein LBI15_02955 [Dysgonamonadaceae bacterium]|jgi:predicted protein tyrosine phosphatase|nr:hypothetical protein [Dysgonamonadaceae bacterium]